MAGTTTAIRGDVEQVKSHDRNFPDHQEGLHARMAAVLSAQRLVARRTPGAGYEFRQALVDLAAISELVADELPRADGALARRQDRVAGHPRLEDMTTAELRRYSEALNEPILHTKAVDRGRVELVSFEVA